MTISGLGDRVSSVDSSESWFRAKLNLIVEKIKKVLAFVWASISNWWSRSCFANPIKVDQKPEVIEMGKDPKDNQPAVPVMAPAIEPPLPKSETDLAHHEHVRKMAPCLKEIGEVAGNFRKDALPEAERSAQMEHKRAFAPCLQKIRKPVRYSRKDAFTDVEEIRTREFFLNQLNALKARLLNGSLSTAELFYIFENYSFEPHLRDRVYLEIGQQRSLFDRIWNRGEEPPELSRDEYIQLGRNRAQNGWLNSDHVKNVLDEVIADHSRELANKRKGRPCAPFIARANPKAQYEELPPHTKGGICFG